MKTNFSHLVAILIILPTFFACEPSRIEVSDTETNGNILILNNGNWGGNDAEITTFNLKSKETNAGAFFKANGQHLGDLGQDIINVNDDIYIAVNNSQIIFLTDHNLKIQKTIIAEADGNRLSPRSMVKGGEKIYVTYYEGYLGEIDPVADHSVRTVKVGPSPEGVAYLDGKIYVANSGGANYPNFDNTISVVDASSFTQTSTIEVNDNPNKIISHPSGKLYVTSYGNYNDMPAKLQVIDLASGTVSDTPYEGVYSIAAGSRDKLYILCGGYSTAGTVYVHDAAANTPYGKTPENLTPFVTDGTTFPNAYSISADTDDNVYIGCSDYVNTGDVYIMDSTGRKSADFDSQGLNPICVINLSSTI